MRVGISRARSPRAAHLGPERRRPQVLDAAREIAVEHGIAEVSMAAIADRLGVTRPVVYACYDGRKALLTALLDREERLLFEGIVSAFPDKPNFDDPEQLIVQGFDVLLGTAAAHSDSWKIVFATDADPVLADRIGRARALVTNQATGLVRSALTAAGTKDVERKVPVLVEIFVATGEAAVRTLLKNGDDWTPNDLAELVGRMVFSAAGSA
ncbi:TetR/AcrR family transcriptional regulator [Antrihabitans spumae]|uniref:TetR/AcrR family transcriptional regulator n=1 Tax=Antrihabitans spumae TaxID=3373370 RepID=A0ABW7K505_9NOCA